LTNTHEGHKGMAVVTRGTEGGGGGFRSILRGLYFHFQRFSPGPTGVIAILGGEGKGERIAGKRLRKWIFFWGGEDRSLLELEEKTPLKRKRGKSVHGKRGLPDIRCVTQEKDKKGRYRRENFANSVAKNSFPSEILGV